MPRRIVVADPSFARRLKELREQRGMSYRAFGTISASYVYELEKGRKPPTPEIAAALDDELDAGGTLAALVTVQPASTRPQPSAPPTPPAGESDDEHDALELARRVAASDIGEETIARLRGAEDAGGWPRRVAAAQIDLSLALVAAGKHDEAVAMTQAAILSGRIVPSNHWRAAEVLAAVEAKGLPEARELRDAYETMRAGQLALPAAK